MRVEVETGSRLHGGFYYIGGDWSVKWAGLGFYVDRPSFRATVTEAPEPCVEGPEYVKELAAKASRAAGLEGFCVKVHDHIPYHMGFGAGTQVLLSLYRAFQVLKGERVSSAADASVRLGRARVSAVGTLLFEKGGFVMDVGLPGKPEALIRLDVPEEWRFIIVVPESVGRGLTDEEEERVFSNLWSASESTLGFMAMGALRLASGIARRDLNDVLEGLRLVQRGTGFYFSKVQGGIYRGPLNEFVAEAWRNRIVLAQSSWGPALYTIVEGDREAEWDAVLLKEILSEVGMKGEVIVARPRNRGAVVRPAE